MMSNQISYEDQIKWNRNNEIDYRSSVDINILFGRSFGLIVFLLLFLFLFWFLAHSHSHSQTESFLLGRWRRNECIFLSRWRHESVWCCRLLSWLLLGLLFPAPFLVLNCRLLLLLLLISFLEVPSFGNGFCLWLLWSLLLGLFSLFTTEL